MNFFQSQQRARQQTGLLVTLFVVAVLALIVLTQLLVLVLFGHSTAHKASGQTGGFFSQFTWASIISIGFGVIAVMVLAAVYKTVQLAKGGQAVAEMLGGVLIQSTSHDPDERKILNVVEEMAIASGTPVPPVYLLEDKGINAFAAGHSSRNAVIGVTRGCIHLLNRDELQGVIAHEFSHIFNGDIRKRPANPSCPESLPEAAC